jgi:hypothetical protein
MLDNTAGLFLIIANYDKKKKKLSLFDSINSVESEFMLQKVIGLYDFLDRVWSWNYTRWDFTGAVR